jgi:hypothetical protein
MGRTKGSKNKPKVEESNVDRSEVNMPTSILIPVFLAEDKIDVERMRDIFNHQIRQLSSRIKK